MRDGCGFQVSSPAGLSFLVTGDALPDLCHPQRFF